MFPGVLECHILKATGFLQLSLTNACGWDFSSWCYMYFPPSRFWLKSSSSSEHFRMIPRNVAGHPCPVHPVIISPQLFCEDMGMSGSQHGSLGCWPGYKTCALALAFNRKAALIHARCPRIPALLVTLSVPEFRCSRPLALIQGSMPDLKQPSATSVACRVACC